MPAAPFYCKIIYRNAEGSIQKMNGTSFENIGQ
jgi:hypothetical protein